MSTPSVIPEADDLTAPQRRAWLTSAVVAVACLVGTAALPRAGLGASDGAALAGLTILVALTERYSLATRIGHETQRLTLSEVPLILGLFLAAPLALVAGRILGTVVALQFLRRQEGYKTAFNVAHIWAETLLVLGVVLPFGSVTITDGAQATLVVLSVATVVALTGALGMTGVLSVMEGRLVRGVALPAMVHGFGPTVATAAATTIGLALGVANPALLWAPAVILAVLLLAYRSHIGLLGARDMQADLITITHDITGGGTVEDTVDRLIAATRTMMDATAASIHLPDSGRPGDLNGWISAAPDVAAALDRAIQVDDSSDLPPAEVTTLVAQIALIQGAWLGVVMDPTHRVDDLDHQAIDMLANHAGVALTNARRGTALQDQADEAQYRSRHDALTGLPNRVALLDQLAEVTAADVPTAILLIDLDNFKEINDALGHAAGDEVLRHLSDRLGPFAGDATGIFRLGGDEFAAIVPGGKTNGLDVAGRLDDVLRKPVMIGPYNLQVGASVGIALYPDHGRDGDQLLKHADLAMYEAKERGGGTAVFGAAAGGRAMRQLAISTGFREALRTGAVTVAFQPIVNLRSGHATGVEALSRWDHPTLGPIRPDEFIIVAEQAGMITDLTQHVLTTTLNWQARWAGDGLDLQVSVNLSARSLLDADLVPMVARSLDACGVDPSRLTLELTEGSVLADPKRTLAVLNRLDRLGVKLSLDDFGTGYSSLAYLRQIPASEVKVDKSFVLPLVHDDTGLSLVSGIIRLCTELGLRVVGEGIEATSVLDTLRGLGCTAGQGFGIARPMPGDDVLDWVVRNRRGTTGLRLITE